MQVCFRAGVAAMLPNYRWKADACLTLHCRSVFILLWRLLALLSFYLHLPLWFNFLVLEFCYCYTNEKLCINISICLVFVQYQSLFIVYCKWDAYALALAPDNYTINDIIVKLITICFKQYDNIYKGLYLLIYSA